MLSLTLAAFVTLAAAEPPALTWKREQIGDQVIYEAASVFDVDKDGNLDIVTGEYWFEGPKFEKQNKICTLQRVDDYYDNFSEYPMDVNGDGYLDIIAGAWWGQTFQWRENPKGGKGEWVTHDVAKVGNIERNMFYDLDGDGTMEVFATTSPVNYFRLKKDGTGFDQFTIAVKGGGGHGFGCGDLNGDKKPDLLFASGWMESTGDPFDVNAWTWHPDWNFGLASCPILVHDVNADGTNDIIVGQGHDYGLAWYEQVKGAEGAARWVKHDIEKDRSQFHEMQLADLDNDGQPELITGKRYRAHAFNDPGSLDPNALYYYKLNNGEFRRMTIDYGPAERASGTGIYLWVADVDNNGWPDIVAPGKQGCYLFKNQGLPGKK